jgi:hypothetical protein
MIELRIAEDDPRMPVDRRIPVAGRRATVRVDRANSACYVKRRFGTSAPFPN